MIKVISGIKVDSKVILFVVCTCQSKCSAKLLLNLGKAMAPKLFFLAIKHIFLLSKIT